MKTVTETTGFNIAKREVKETGIGRVIGGSTTSKDEDVRIFGSFKMGDESIGPRIIKVFYGILDYVKTTKEIIQTIKS